MSKTLRWPEYEIVSILETTDNAEVNADAMLRTLAEIRALPVILSCAKVAA